MALLRFLGGAVFVIVALGQAGTAAEGDTCDLAAVTIERTCQPGLVCSGSAGTDTAACKAGTAAAGDTCDLAAVTIERTCQPDLVCSGSAGTDTAECKVADHDVCALIGAPIKKCSSSNFMCLNAELEHCQFGDSVCWCQDGVSDYGRCSVKGSTRERFCSSSWGLECLNAELERCQTDDDCWCEDPVSDGGRCSVKGSTRERVCSSSLECLNVEFESCQTDDDCWCQEPSASTTTSTTTSTPDPSMRNPDGQVSEGQLCGTDTSCVPGLECLAQQGMKIFCDQPIAVSACTCEVHHETETVFDGAPAKTVLAGLPVLVFAVLQ